jgi:hypothetical protein
MINVLFYGNCQVASCNTILNLDSNKYSQKIILCFSTDISKKEFHHYVINADIIITQSIKDNYREKDYLSTSYLFAHRKHSSKVIFFDSCYFDLYHFDCLTWHISEPSAYHYQQLINYYKQNISPEEFLTNVVNSWDLKTTEELEQIVEKNLNELDRRNYDLWSSYGNMPNVFIISINEYIRFFYKEKLLFYTVNHPSKFILQYLCENILAFMNEKNTMNYHADPLNTEKNIIYKCVQKIVNFNIYDHQPLVKHMDNDHSVVKSYFETYRRLGI